MKVCIIFLSLLLIPLQSIASDFSPGATYQQCFTPGENCTQEIIDALNKAKNSIRVQAYSFTSAPIMQALVDAKNRGVDVRVILDKGQYKEGRYTSATFLRHNAIPVWVDYKPAIAHNKVMIIDNSIVIAGSFNFTKAAQQRNAENVSIITDKVYAEGFIKNWEGRLKVSKETG